MRLIEDAQPLGNPPAPVHLAIGVFDGVHVGHATVLRQTLEDARAQGGEAVAVTFDRHPNAVVAPDRSPPMLYPLWRRLEALQEAGIPNALVFAFDAEFSRQTGEAFLERLRLGFGRLAGVTVGAGFVFGRQRSGNLELLRQLGERHGFAVRGVPPLEMDGEVVSSTRLRELVAAGQLELASRLLGRPYSIAGEIQRGDGLGRQLGFPTANVGVEGLVLPPSGVYAASFRWGGSVRAAAVNLGTRPTVAPGGGGVRVEAHLLDFAGDLYGCRAEVTLGPRLRGERKFSSKAALVEQVGRDVEEVRTWAGNKGLP